VGEEARITPYVKKVSSRNQSSSQISFYRANLGDGAIMDDELVTDAEEQNNLGKNLRILSQVDCLCGKRTQNLTGILPALSHEN